MIDAMDRLRKLQCQAEQKPTALQKNQPVQFGQKITPMHSQPKHGGDVFVKSIKPTDMAAKPAVPAKSPNPFGTALQNFVKQAGKADNPLVNALKKLAPASESAKLEATRKSVEAQPVQSPFMKAGEHKLASPEKAFATQPTSAQIYNRNKINLFAGAAVTAAGLGALGAAVLGPASLAANPALLNKMVALLPTQLP